MARSYTITQSGESRSYTIDDGVGAPGTDAEVTTTNVRAAVPNMVEVASPVNDDMIQRVGGSWVTRTIAQVKTALGLGSAAYTASTDYVAVTGNQTVAGSKNFTGNTVSSGSLTIGVANSGLEVLTYFPDPDGVVYSKILQPGFMSGTRTLTLPDESGTFALTNDSRFTDERVPTAAGLAAKITAATSKATPVDADELPLADSAASFGLKKLTWANLKATLKNYFDTFYVALTGNQTIEGEKTFSSKLTVSAGGALITGDSAPLTTNPGGYSAFVGYQSFSSGWAGSGFSVSYPTLAPFGLVVGGDGAAYFGAPETNAVWLRASGSGIRVYGSVTFSANSGAWDGATFTGAQAFSSTTRPTSSGTGTPASNSLITREDGDLRFANLPDVILDGQQKLTDGVTQMWINTVTGSGSGLQASQYLAVATGGTTGSTSHFCASPSISLIFSKDGESGLGWNFDSKWIVTFRANINDAVNNTDGYFVLGQANGSTSTAQPSTKSCGFRFHNQGVYGFVHDGSTYVESSSSLLTLSSTNVNQKYEIHNDDTNINFYINGVLLDSITAPTGTTGNGFQAITFWANNETTTNDMAIRIHGGIKFSNIP